MVREAGNWGQMGRRRGAFLAIVEDLDLTRETGYLAEVSVHRNC